MYKKFNPKKYGMMVYPFCYGYGRIRSSGNVRVCENCAGFGFIRGEVEGFDQEGKPIAPVGQ